jgi:serine/threonine protein kinase
VTRRKDAPMWIITQVISDLTLEDFVNKCKSKITFHKALLLTQQILEIIQRCHKVHIFHRNLHPNNIMVQYSNDHGSIDEIKLVIIDFGLAWIDSQELLVTDEDDLKMIDQVIKKHSKSELKHLLLSSSKSQHCSPTVDSIGVCRILFWLLTDKWFDQVSYTPPPHHESEYQQLITEKLGRIKRILI